MLPVRSRERVTWSGVSCEFGFAFYMCYVLGGGNTKASASLVEEVAQMHELII